MGGVPLVVRSPDSNDRTTDRVEAAQQTAQELAHEVGLHEATAVGDTGDPADAIIAAAKSQSADVVVVGTHERGWFKRLFSSSVSDAVDSRRRDPSAGGALMARALWTGSINFGLVNVPVKAFTAVRDHDVHFHQLDKKSGSRIRYHKVAEETGKEVDGTRSRWATRSAAVATSRSTTRR